jgi:hypothetical protein
LETHQELSSVFRKMKNEGVIPPDAVEVMSASMADISFCGMATDASNHLAVKVFTELIHYF